VRYLQPLLLLPLLALLVGCPFSRRPLPQDDDDGADDDDSGGDDDTVDDDDAAPDDDDDADDDDAADDDDGAPDDDDDTPDPLPLCMESVLEFIGESGMLPEQSSLGDLPAQQVYSCETYQLQGVNLLSTPSAPVTTGSAPTWTLETATPVSVNDAAAPATLSLTGCDPYTCGLYTNTFTASSSVTVTLSQSYGPGNAPFVDVVFGLPTHDIQGQLQGNFIITDCSLGNLNEDLQANGVDIFTVLVNDVGPQWGLAIQLHLQDVAFAAEELSFGCWE
jgi:hypothetical protein